MAMKRNELIPVGALVSNGRLALSKVREGTLAWRIICDAVRNGSVRMEHHRSRGCYYLSDRKRFEDTFRVHCPGFDCLDGLLVFLSGKALTRSERVTVTGDSKAGGFQQTVLGFSLFARQACSLQFSFGFYDVIPKVGLHIREDCFPILPERSCVVIVENAEPFYLNDWVDNLGREGEALFVCCRYPSSRVMKDWLLGLPLSVRIVYVGDIDLSGIQKYETEFKAVLGDRISFYVPDNLQELMLSKANYHNYAVQSASTDRWCRSQECKEILSLLHSSHSGIEQELYKKR